MTTPLRFQPRFLFAFLALALAACSTPSDGTGADAGVQPLPRSELFGPCVDDAQCPGVGAFCQKATDGYPQGVCTKPCADRTFCDAYGTWNWCLPDKSGRNVCVQKCLNGIDCSREAYTCTTEIAGGAGSCYPVCSKNEQCGPGSECHLASGLCVAAGTLPKAKAPNGAGCLSDDECASGDCREEVVDGKPTGYVGGSCVGPCILPGGWNTNTVYSGDELPPGTCAADMVCYPVESFGRGSAGTCRPACAADSDCRPGYSCLLDFNVKKFKKGMCVRQDCTQKDCPSGYLCKRSDTGYVCARAE